MLISHLEESKSSKCYIAKLENNGKKRKEKMSKMIEKSD